MFYHSEHLYFFSQNYSLQKESLYSLIAINLSHSESDCSISFENKKFGFNKLKQQRIKNKLE